MAIANNEIWYTTSDGQTVTPSGLTPTSNTYSGGKGVMVFANDVTTIPANFLNGYNNLTSIELPQSVTGIGSFAFIGNINLTSATVYEGLTTIGTYVFLGTNLVEFGWPASVTGLSNDYCGQFWNSGDEWSADTLTHTLRLNQKNLGNVSCWGNWRLNQIIFSENVTGASGNLVFYSNVSNKKATGLTDIWFEHETSLPSSSGLWNALSPSSSNYIPTTGTLHLFRGVDESNLQGGITAWTKVYYDKKTATAMTVSDVTWVTDIAGSGGTGDSGNCSYSALVEFDDGSVEINPAGLQVTGSITAASNTSHLRRDVGQLNLTFSIGELSYQTSVEAYQAGLFENLIPYNNMYSGSTNLVTVEKGLNQFNREGNPINMMCKNGRIIYQNITNITQ